MTSSILQITNGNMYCRLSTLHRNTAVCFGKYGDGTLDLSIVVFVILQKYLQVGMDVSHNATSTNTQEQPI